MLPGRAFYFFNLFLCWNRACLYSLSDQKTSELSSKKSIYSSVLIYTSAPGISNLISKFNSSWCVELLIAYKTLFWHQSCCSWPGRLLEISTKNLFLLPGGFNCLILTSREDHVSPPKIELFSTFYPESDSSTSAITNFFIVIIGIMYYIVVNSCVVRCGK